MSSVFDTTNRKDTTKSLAFFDPDGGVTLQRFENVKYRQFDKLTDKSLSFFWRPEEIDVTKDGIDFKNLTVNEKHIYFSNIRRQIILDSVQGRSPNLAFLPVVSLPELEAWITTWAFSETIHSRSYTHILRGVYANPSIVFDEIMEIKEIVDCAKDISRNYDNLIELSAWYRLLGEGNHLVNGKTVEVSLYKIKTALWLAIMSVNILEGIRFYVSFACSFAFAETKKMCGSASIIKLIARDENLHLASTQMLLKLLPSDDPDYITISEETKDISRQLFKDAIQQEKDWARYLFADGSIIGLNEQLLSEYVDYIAYKRMVSVGLKPFTKAGSNPLPWTQKWLSGADVQVAPQETEITSYQVGETVQDVKADTFKGFSL